MDWLSKSERKFARFGIPNLITYVVAGRALAYLLSRVNPEFPLHLILDPDAVMRGEVWRLLTYLFTPPLVAGTGIVSIVLALIQLYVTLLLGRAVEQIWGAYRFTLYYLLGAIAIACASFFLLHAPATPDYLDISLLLAFATLAPDYTFLLFVIPVKVKWIAWLSICGQAVMFAKSSLPARLAILIELSNYFLFFRPQIWSWAMAALGVRRLRSAARARAPVHRCSVCRITERDHPEAEFRICACPRCGEWREFCMDHLLAHRLRDGDA